MLHKHDHVEGRGNLITITACYVISCYVMLCCVMSCYVMLCYAMLCYVTLCYKQDNGDMIEYEIKG